VGYGGTVAHPFLGLSVLFAEDRCFGLLREAVVEAPPVYYLLVGFAVVVLLLLTPLLRDRGGKGKNPIYFVVCTFFSMGVSWVLFSCLFSKCAVPIVYAMLVPFHGQLVAAALIFSIGKIGKDIQMLVFVYRNVQVLL
jgi:hypothetical protein